MAYARVSYTGNGSTKIFTVPFPYIDPVHLEVRVGGVLKTVATDYTWLTTSTLQFITAPALGKTVFLLRNTPKEARLVNYQDAAILREADLDLDSDQSFYIVQEALDAAENTQAIETFTDGVDFTAGVTTTLTLGAGDIEMSNLLVLFDAAAQQQTEYTLAAGVITFDSAIPVGVLQVQVSYATPLTSGLINGSVTTPTIADLNVTTAKLADLNVTTAKLADLAITEPKLADLSVTEPKLAQAVFNDLTAVSAAIDDYVVIADASNSGNKRKALVSSLVALTQLGTVFSARNSGSQSLTTGVVTAATLASEDFDTAGKFASSRFTPSVAGYYQINCASNINGSTITNAYVAIYRNGVELFRGGQYAGSSITAFASSASGMLSLNGTTDYVELYVYAIGTVLTAAPSYLSGFIVRTI